MGSLYLFTDVHSCNVLLYAWVLSRLCKRPWRNVVSCIYALRAEDRALLLKIRESLHCCGSECAASGSIYGRRSPRLRSRRRYNRMASWHGSHQNWSTLSTLHSGRRSADDIQWTAEQWLVTDSDLSWRTWFDDENDGREIFAMIDWLRYLRGR